MSVESTLTKQVSRRTALRGGAAALLVGGASVASAAPANALVLRYPIRWLPETWQGCSTNWYYRDSTRFVQRRFQMLGYNLAVDGSFGSATDAVARAFQRSRGLRQDGCVGVNTLAAMGMSGVRYLGDWMWYRVQSNGVTVSTDMGVIKVENRAWWADY